MMYMHYCKHCNRIHMLNGHKFDCPNCCGPLVELSISYLEYANMDMDQRAAFKDRCNDQEQLKHLSTTYRLYKYSKWYKEMNGKNGRDNAPDNGDKSS